MKYIIFARITIFDKKNTKWEKTIYGANTHKEAKDKIKFLRENSIFLDSTELKVIKAAKNLK